MRRAYSLSAVLAAAIVLSACPGRDDSPPQTQQPATTQPATPAPGAGATAAGAGQLPPGVTAQMVQEGNQIYHQQGICFTCHGQNATGGPLAPALNDQQWIHITGEYEEIVNIIRTGVPNPRQYPAAMPPMGGATLNDNQLRAVSAYVYSISHGG
jgi:mono/diheme cytochrome c family protein